MTLSGKQILAVWAAGALLVTAAAAVTLKPLEARETVTEHAPFAALEPMTAGANLYYLSNAQLQDDNVARQRKAMATAQTVSAERRLTLFLRISGSAALSTLVAAGMLAVIADSGGGEREARRASILFRREVQRRRRRGQNPLIVAEIESPRGD